MFVIDRDRRMVSKSKKFGISGSFWNYVFLGMLIFAAIVLSVVTFGKPVERFTSAAKTLEYFYMPSCPHCKDFNPIWDDVCSKVSQEDIAVRTQKHNLMGDGEELGKKYNVNAAPTILLISETGQVKEYQGPRDVNAIVAFVKDA